MDVELVDLNRSWLEGLEIMRIFFAECRDHQPSLS